MALIRFALGAVPLLFACSGPNGAAQHQVLSSQESYEYGTCSKGRDECPHDRALACALQTIASGYNTCTREEDCVAANLHGRCSDAGSCPPLYVNHQMKGAFEVEAQREIDKYCGNAACKNSGLCWVTGFRARCTNSHCTHESLGVRAGF